MHVSTDSEKYAEIGRQFGADVSFLRDSELAGDKSSTWDALRYVMWCRSTGKEEKTLNW